MINCVHKTDVEDVPVCEIASRIAGRACEVNDYACKVCSRSRKPRQVNRATLAIAMHCVGHGSQEAKEIKSTYASILDQPSAEEMQKRRLRGVPSTANCRSMSGAVMWNGFAWVEIEPCFRDIRSDCNCQMVTERDGNYVGEVLSLPCRPEMEPEVQRNVAKYEDSSAAWDSSPTPIDDWIIVTSLSLMPHHQESQRTCLKSWSRLGVRVFSGNTSSEIELLKSQYPNVEFVEVRNSKAFERKTPRIYDLMRIGGSAPKLLINSDIEILGDGSRIGDAAKGGRAIVGIRHNWAGSRLKSEREMWGLDAFLLHPNQIETFPDIDFAIGQIMWDYWIPFHLDLHGFEIDWIGDPYFYHAAHESHWQTDSFDMARRMLLDHYSAECVCDDLTEWRRSKPFSDQVA